MVVFSIEQVLMLLLLLAALLLATTTSSTSHIKIERERKYAERADGYEAVYKREVLEEIYLKGGFEQVLFAPPITLAIIHTPFCVRLLLNSKSTTAAEEQAFLTITPSSA
ncbi:hypothetical protein HELRODRAFT_160243 [Helobdella robusta]|uniref:Uncharacterized protein n=1 Tax=Helobdella robusta TaxID=6412 RepID=T1EQ08_HELRO|nr:hypothetical protein HELRODRAFT_160243 [Helobdella robusta]ESO06107.1 hypothetical protein HELRODRAFT_160243 [Helobdella robusta]